MLEKVDLGKKIKKKEYKRRRKKLRTRLYDLQKACWDAGIPTMVVFEGWDAAGKGTSINVLTQRLDPRGFSLHAIQAPRTYETHMPWLWRFWLKIPNYGEMAIFDRSWYGRVLVERVEALTPKEEWRKAYRDIVNFERTLSDDGYVIVKFFLHISKKEQKRRFKKIEKDPLEAWRVQPEDWEHHKKYDEYVLAIEEMLERTDTEWGRWTIVEATNKRWTHTKIFETLINRMEEELERRGLPLPLGEEAQAAAQAEAEKEAEAEVQVAAGEVETEEIEVEETQTAAGAAPEDEEELDLAETPKVIADKEQEV